MGRQNDWSPLKDREKVSSVCQLCLVFCDTMNRSTPGLPVHHQLAESTQTHVPELVMPSNHLFLCRPLLLLPQYFPASESLPRSPLFASGGQNIGVSVSTSVFPMNTQDWYPLGWTGWISLQSKGLSRVFSNTTVQKYQFFGAQLFYTPTLNPYLSTGKTIALTRQTFVAKVMSLFFFFFFNINLFNLMGG